ncbi:amylo-alpha-1,6-glucosidase [Marinilabilia rubra]|uniref:Glycogen debranching protein n=1 Tax=Marinilabilia rubra TaxID=2162893 RepID=A0A2U2B842_9BACT|nr:amylo-alpha-1,6-glucosidase [Marinilabilia rubra]PWD99213.1 glycogen debranching protein [Marinilabilia rubra]
MAYYQLEKARLVNLEYALYREILRTNRAGSYCSTTIIGCNTRKYHGLLVCPLENFGGDLFVLLSALDVSVVQHDREFNLGIHKYQGSHYEPKGHKYLTGLEVDDIPKRYYRVGGVILSTEMVLVEKEEQLLFKVTLEEAHSDTKIRFKPFLAFRSIHELTHQNLNANTRYQKVNNGVSLKMYDGFPSLNLQSSKETEFIPVPDWYLGVEYLKEQHRGYAFKEDLFVPGYFETDIRKGESIVMSASTSEVKPNGLKAKFTREKKKRIPRDSMINNLLNSGQQFLLDKGTDVRLLAGFHWYGERHRDTLLSLPGLSVYQEEKKAYKNILEYISREIEEKYLYNNKSLLNRDIDVPLWFFWTLKKCPTNCSPENIWSKYKEIMQAILDHYRNLDQTTMYMNGSGLLYAKKAGVPLTWMEAIVDDEPVTWRPGFTVELNALWYNALMTFSELANKAGEEEIAKPYLDLAERVKDAFVPAFWNGESECLFDYVDGNYKDASIRPNQIFAASLPYSPLSVEQRKAIVDVVKKELLTPRGLRTLSPQDPKYKGVFEGGQRMRDKSMHQGTVFPWLAAFFAEAYLDIHKQGGLSFVKRILEGFEEEMGNHCLGSISECFNGNPPHLGKGAISMAWNVAGVLHIIYLIEKYSIA